MANRMPEAESLPGDRFGEVSLADILERGDLSRRHSDGVLQAYHASAFDLEVLDVADAAIRRHVPTALVLPVPGANTAVLLATCILVHHFCQTRSLTAQVALATRQLRLRSFYDSLYFKREHLVDFFPRTLVTREGPVDIGSRPEYLSDRPGRLHFLTGLGSLTDLRRRLDGIVIEAAAAEPAQVNYVVDRMGGRVPLVYVATNPFDSALDTFSERGAVWAWDAAWLTYLLEGRAGRASLCGEIDTLRGACDTSFSVVSPDEATGVDGRLAALWGDLTTVQRCTGGVTFEALGWVWGTYGALSHLALPLSVYDEEARVAWGVTPLSEAPTKAALFASNSFDEDQREYWEVLASDLGDAVGAVEEDNRKPQLLTEWVAERAESKETGLIVTRNRAAKRGVKRHVDGKAGVPLAWGQSIGVCTLSELQRGEHKGGYTHALFTGPVPSRYSSLLALPAAQELTVLGHGHWEASRAVNQIQATLARLAALAHGEVRERALARLSLGRFPDGPTQPLPVRIRLRREDVRAAHPPVSEPVWDPFDIEIVGSLGVADPDCAPPVGTVAGKDGKVRAIRIRFRDGIAFFEPDRLLTVVRAETEELAAKGLRRGDRVILIDRGARRDLFDEITDRLADLPEFTATVALIREWQRRALLGGVRHGFDFQRILQKMQPDTRITTTQTIRNWIFSWVKGPGDPREIRIFGEAVGDHVLADHWEPIGRALRTIRGHHKKIGKMLARVLAGIAPTDLEDAGYFDRRLGIHYSDLMEAVTVHDVVEASSDVREIPVQYANHLLNLAEAAQLESD